MRREASQSMKTKWDGWKRFVQEEEEDDEEEEIVYVVKEDVFRCETSSNFPSDVFVSCKDHVRSFGDQAFHRNGRDCFLRHQAK